MQIHIRKSFIMPMVMVVLYLTCMSTAYADQAEDMVYTMNSMLKDYGVKFIPTNGGDNSFYSGGQKH